MGKYILGRVVPIYKGGYNSTETYEALDIVLYGGSSFVSLIDENTGHTPSEGQNSYWGLIAKHGERSEMSQGEIEALITTVYNAMVDRGAIFDAEYVHTDNNYTDEDKAVIEDITSNPTKYLNVQADWDITDPTSPAFIKNKPDFVIDPNYTHNPNPFTNEDKAKLDSINTGAEKNVQADWKALDTNSDAFIKNKPTIPTHTSQLTNNSNFVVDANYVHNPNPFTNALKTKLQSTNVLTDAMVTRINTIVPEPTVNTITQTSFTIGNLQGNYVYNFTNPITSLQISASNVEFVPTLFYFTTGETFHWQFPSSMMSTQFLDFDPNTSYVMAVMNNVISYAELVDPNAE